VIETGTLLKKEVQKQTDNGIKIKKAFDEKKYVEDEVVIQVVKKKIADLEKENKNWVIEGFPRTKVQALSLETLGIIPDKIIQLTCSREKSLQRIKTNLLEQDINLHGDVLHNAAKNSLQEYYLFHKGVVQVFSEFLFTVDTMLYNKPQVE